MTKRSADNHGIAGLNSIPTCWNFFISPSDTACINVNFISLSRTDDFCISSNDFHSGFFGCFFNTQNYFFQRFYLETGFNNQRQRQRVRFCSHHCQIIYRTANAQVSDISAWKKDRLHDKGISCKDQFSAVIFQNRAIVLFSQNLIIKFRPNQIVQQFLHLSTAAAMSERYLVFGM